MVEFKIKIHPKQRLAYFPRQLVKELGVRLKALPNSRAMVLYPEDAPPTEVLASLEVIKADLKLRAKRMKRREGRSGQR